jgi:hypothetical protein
MDCQAPENLAFEHIKTAQKINGLTVVIPLINCYALSDTAKGKVSTDLRPYPQGSGGALANTKNA